VDSYTLQASSAFLDWHDIQSPELEAVRRDGLTIASVAAASGRLAPLNAAMVASYGTALPSTPSRVALRDDLQAIWSGPDQWLVIADRAQGRDLEAELAPRLQGLASVTDQSDARAVVRISGPAARSLLAKGVGIDLHPRVFPANGAAVTHASHIGVILWLTDDRPTYDVAMFRSFADSFGRWLHHSALEWAA
jgi:heterotetrameric sarcosine oxidase gamma subunit